MTTPIRKAFDAARAFRATVPLPSGPVVYFVQSGDFINIGFSANAEGRIRSLRTGAAQPLRVLLTVPGNREKERLLHYRFRGARAEGEWFFATPSLLSFIDEIREQIVTDSMANQPG